MPYSLIDASASPLHSLPFNVDQVKQHLGYIFGHSLVAGKTGSSREEQQNLERASSPKWLFLRLATKQVLLLPAPTNRVSRGGKHHEERVSCLRASGSAENAPTTGTRFSKPRVFPEQEAYERLRPIVLFGETAAERAKVWRHSLARSMAQGVTNTWTGKTVGWTGGIPAF